MSNPPKTFTCGFCGEELASANTKHTIADCAYHLKAELAERDRMLELVAGALATAVWDGLEYRRHTPSEIRTITAAGPLLRSYYANPASVRPDMTKAAILADLRARAEGDK